MNTDMNQDPVLDDELLDSLEDQAVPMKESSNKRTPAIDAALKRIAEMRAKETSSIDTFPSPEAYREHKNELNDREIVILLGVRDENPTLIDSLIELMDRD